MKNKAHIKFEGHFKENIYKTPKRLISDKPVARERSHGNYLLNKIEEIKKVFEIQVIENSDLLIDDSVYIEFVSEWGTKFEFDKFDKDGVRKNKILFQLLKIEEEERISEEKKEFRYSLLVVVNENGVSEFIKKIKQFLDPSKDSEKGNFKNQALLNNIKSIEIATLKSFWVDGLHFPFPNENENVWWEVWFRKSDNSIDKLNSVYNNLDILGCQIGQSQIELAEYIVKLVKATSKQLSDSLLLLDNLAELRKPQEIANFIESYEDKREWLNDLKDRTENSFNENSVLICLLDTGINNKHPLLENFVFDENLHSHNESWGVQDNYPNGGHGTGVAGLALYGDLTDALSSSENINIYHGLESFKIFNNIQEDEKFDGPKFENAVSIPLINKPNNLRIYCLTILRNNVFNGRPSASSATIDKICFGKELGQQLFIVSGGNVVINKHDDYPVLNELQSISDPGQAYNALTVGTYTRKDKIDISTGYKPLVENGAMSPSNSTSILFDNSWPNKPDIVFEGGNRSTDGVYTSDHSELRLLTTDSDFANDMFISFGDTSGAAALASKMAAELRTNYPNYWVETIRGLMVHSADWTNAMKKNAQVKRNLLRTVGYGVPSIQKAMYSVENSLTLIAEREIQPYKYEKSRGQYKEYHLFNLPWPIDALQSLEEKSVKLIVTLSYYIEPNPGSRRLATHYSYHSHQLDFDLIKRNETIPEFQIRISKPEDETKENKPKRNGAEWEIGFNTSSKGSIRKDFITMPGRVMSERNTLAVFPKNGWYKNLKRQNKFNEKVRYSLIVSLETEENEIDLYTPVMNQLTIPL
ncbi:S8 family peptidase [Flavobacterium geliluteum]|uniref:S8 family peptidase n=1 Tax=Flavobacterium geliluteum TaxID=2816120 RepID=A0A941AYY1_9FLAO|nr:S8 family peptidase [Flavobacterium geliluteum]MBP4138312.1 S8 family peptidase [Flavobacterium geliluteum]